MEFNKHKQNERESAGKQVFFVRSYFCGRRNEVQRNIVLNYIDLLLSHSRQEENSFCYGTCNFTKHSTREAETSLVDILQILNQAHLQ
jgi:hypothetical protein